MKTRSHLNLFLVGLFLAQQLLCSAQVFGKEAIYHFDFRKGSYFGEMYHVALGLLSDPQAFVYLPLISDLPKEQQVDPLKTLEMRPEARQALVIYGFLKEIGLDKRIISEKTFIPSSGMKVFGLIGKDRPDGSGKFHSPFTSSLADSTQVFEEFNYRNNEEPLKKAAILFTRSGSDPPTVVKEFIQEEIAPAQSDNKPLLAIWNRQDPSYQTERNMSRETLSALINESVLRGYKPMILGPPIDPSWKEIHKLVSQGTLLDMTEIWKKKPFSQWGTQVTRQLDFFRELKKQGRLIGQIGMKGGALDGPAIAATLPTIELVIPEDTQNQGAKSRRILRFANSIGNMTILEVDKAGSVRNPYTTEPIDWLDLLTNPQILRRNCKLLYEHLGLRVKERR